MSNVCCSSEAGSSAGLQSAVTPAAQLAQMLDQLHTLDSSAGASCSRDNFGTPLLPGGTPRLRLQLDHDEHDDHDSPNAVDWLHHFAQNASTSGVPASSPAVDFSHCLHSPVASAALLPSPKLGLGANLSLCTIYSQADDSTKHADGVFARSRTDCPTECLPDERRTCTLDGHSKHSGLGDSLDAFLARAENGASAKRSATPKRPLPQRQPLRCIGNRNNKRAGGVPLQKSPSDGILQSGQWGGRKRAAADCPSVQSPAPAKRGRPGAPLLRIFSEAEIDRPRNVQHHQRLYDDAHLIGDFSRHCSLPTLARENTDPHCQDLKNISAETLAHLLGDRRADRRLRLVDCRYPYEFGGGHIAGASNVHTAEQLQRTLAAQHRLQQAAHEDIVVFYCEFSQMRGPRMTRLLRNLDRRANGHRYPQLAYPEVYLLAGGYSHFFKHFPSLCTPQSYVRMNDIPAELAKYKPPSGKGRKAGKVPNFAQMSCTQQQAGNRRKLF